MPAREPLHPGQAERPDVYHVPLGRDPGTHTARGAENHRSKLVLWCNEFSLSTISLVISILASPPSI